MKRTRESLIDAALSSFSEQGLDAPSLDAICARAGCTRGAFYVHFRDRDELIAATMERRRSDVLGMLLGATNASIAEVLDVFVRALESGQFPPPGAVRTGELLAACRRSPSIRAAHHRLLEQTLKRLTERIESDQKCQRLRIDIAPSAIALTLLLVEAGAELLLDLAFPFEARSAASTLTKLLVPGAPQ
jgi:AcrR family transcriptional regulator